MRPFRRCSLCPLVQLRRCSGAVGPAQFVNRPVEEMDFGSQRRRRHRHQVQQLHDKARNEERHRRRCVPSAEQEHHAEGVCRTDYHFLSKPLHYPYWSWFLPELQQYSLEWRLASANGQEVEMTLKEFAVDGERVLLRAVGGLGEWGSPFGQMFESLIAFVRGAATERTVHFSDRRTQMQLKLHFSLGGEGDGSTLEPSVRLPDGRLSTGAQTQRSGASVELSSVVGDSSDAQMKPLCDAMSLQAFIYHFLASVPPFLKRTDLGVRTSDLVPREQFVQFRLGWCFLRREARMSPLDLNAFDLLIPPPC